MTLEFFMSQLRVFLVALIAYLGGRGIFTPADATLATVALTSLGPIAGPWLFSIWTNYGVKKVPVNSVAIEIAPGDTVPEIGTHLVQSSAVTSGAVKVVG